jgi:hypothetical protein
MEILSAALISHSLIGMSIQKIKNSKEFLKIERAVSNRVGVGWGAAESFTINSVSGNKP